MRFLKIKKRKGRARSDGSTITEMVIVEKNRKYGDVLSEKGLSVKSSILITGANASGKSRWLERMHKEAATIWGGRAKHTPIYLAAVQPIAAWVDVPHVAAWWDKKLADKPNEIEENRRRAYKQLRNWEKADAVAEYLEATNAILFVDDAHKLSGMKAEIARKCINTAKLWVVAASNEQRIRPGLRHPILNSKPQTVHLDSDVAYDMTGPLMWAAATVAFIAGFYGLAGVIGGMRLLSGGLRAARQE